MICKNTHILLPKPFYSFLFSFFVCEKYIFTNQENADEMFNSSLLYELSILKVYAEPLLYQVPTDKPAYLEANRLLKFLDYFLGVSSESLPSNSVCREFVGGSCFKV